MRRTTVKILVDPHYYDSYIKPDVDAFKSVWPTPLWKMRKEWWNSESKLLKPGSESDTQFFKRSFVGCPSTRNWVEKSIAFMMPDDVEIVPDLENDTLIINPQENHRKAWGTEFHPQSQLNMYTNQHMNVKWTLPYEIVTDQPIMFLPPHLHKQHFSYPFTTMHGFVQSFHTTPVFINTLIDVPTIVEEFKKTGRSSIILAGSPIAYVTFPTLEGRIDVEFEERKYAPMGYWASAKKLFRLR